MIRMWMDKRMCSGRMEVEVEWLKIAEGGKYCCVDEGKEECWSGG